VACDLSDLGSAAAAAEYIRISHAPLDGIIANAEISHLPALQIRYGVEMQFLGNYLGHFAGDLPDPSSKRGAHRGAYLRRLHGVLPARHLEAIAQATRARSDPASSA
jgi:hypothetical protein